MDINRKDYETSLWLLNKRIDKLEDMASQNSSDKVIVDEQLSATSTNPVQNKVVTGAIQETATNTLDTARSHTDKQINALGQALGENLTNHIDNKTNPHTVTKSQIGLDNVPNVTTNDQTPTYTAAPDFLGLSSGEKLSVAFGKIARAIIELQNHIENMANPHKVGLDNLGILATAEELNFVGGATSNIQSQLNGKAPSSHGTHVLFSPDDPAAAGTASAGSTSTVARSDHVHPAQTSVSGNAGSATKLATARKVDGVSFDGAADITHYGTCSTAAATAAKAVSCTGFALVTGARIAVKFSNTNTAASPTLNVNSTGAKAVYYNGAAISAGYLKANRILEFIYNGTQWEYVGEFNTNTTYSAMTGATTSAAGKTGLVPAPAAGNATRYLRSDGTWQVPPDNNTTYNAATTSAAGLMSAADKAKLNYTNVAYGTCSTAAATAAKVVTVSGNTNWALTAGSTIIVKFSATNTAQNPTLNVNNTGAKSIWYNTALITTSNLGYGGTANRPMKFVYDGTQYIFIGWSLDNNTTYSPASLGQGYGTCATAAATTAKVVTLSNYALVTNGMVAVKFTYAVPASATMNINSKGAKAIYYRGAAITAGIIDAGDIGLFIYNGSQYHLLSVDKSQKELDSIITDATITAFKNAGLPIT